MMHDPLCTILLLVLGQLRVQRSAAPDLPSAYLHFAFFTVGSAIYQLGCIHNRSIFLHILNGTTPKTLVPHNHACFKRDKIGLTSTKYVYFACTVAGQTLISWRASWVSIRPLSASGSTCLVVGRKDG